MKKKILGYLFCVMAGTAVLLSGTSSSATETVQQQAAGEATGTADVLVTGSIKTHSKWYHILEQTTRGTGAYTMEVEVGGKTHQLAATPIKEVTKQGDRKNPEEGTGARFRFSGNFSVPVGNHKVIFRLPQDNVVVSSDMTFAPGVNKLVVKPVYGKITRNRIMNFRGERHFSQHVETLAVSLEGK